MWRVPVSIVLSGLLGSALATVLSMMWTWISGIGTGPLLDAVWIVLFIDASLFTVPGAILLSLLEIGLSGKVTSTRTIDMALLGFGAVAGAAILGTLGMSDEKLGFAVAGGFYGLSTATLFVVFQHQFGARKERRL
jgi:hypothetical protein